jgi:hypothetical protein
MKRTQQKEIPFGRQLIYWIGGSILIVVSLGLFCGGHFLFASPVLVVGLIGVWKFLTAPLHEPDFIGN